MIDRYYDKFQNRKDALSKLLDIVPSRYFSPKDSILIALSEGGLLLASEIAKRMNTPLDFLFTEAIRANKNPDCKIAIVSESMDIVINEELVRAFGITYEFIYGEAQRKYEEKILHNIYKFRKGEIISSLHNKNVAIVDDGIDTGLIVNVAIKSCIKKGANTIIVATPVVSDDVANMIEERVDGVYSVYRPKHFVNTRYYYIEEENIDSNAFRDMLDAALSNIVTKE